VRPGSAPETPTTLSQALERAAGFADTGLRFLDRRERPRWLPWEEVGHLARRVACGLRQLGVEPGERVALVYPTGPEFIAAFFGTLLARAVPVPLYPPVRLGRLEEYHRRTAGMLRAASARLLLTERRVQRLLGETLEAARPDLGCRTLAGLPEGDAPPLEASPEDLALVQFSSGTTVAPKPVALTHRAVMAHVRILNGFWPDTDEVRHSGVSWLPLYHDMGLIGCVFPALERPGVLTLIGPEVFVARPAVWLRAISRYRATLSPAPNFAYGLCVDKIADEELEGVDLSCWRVALNGAEAVAPEVLRAFNRRFARWGLPPTALTPVYGLSEAALAVTFSELDEPFTAARFDREKLTREGRALPAEDGIELVSVGRPIPGFEVRVMADEAAGGAGPAERVPREDGRVGRLWVRGPSLMEGYLGQPEATARALVDGWLDTGDLGFFHRGRLYLVGRAKDVVILHGRNFAPEVLEHAVSRVEGVRTGCVVATSWLPEGGRREELYLFVETAREASTAAVAALPGACREAVLGAAGLTPDHILVLEPGTLPRTSSGKLRRQETLRLHLAGELEPPDPVNPVRLAGALARSGLAYRRARRRGDPEGG
jgi:acyl-CoA synthetase (AMP-forming)/AMP-acid ligase II